MASLSGYGSLHLPWHGFVEAKEVVWSYAISDVAHNFYDTGSSSGSVFFQTSITKKTGQGISNLKTSPC